MLWVCLLLLVCCALILCQVFFLSSTGVFLTTDHGFNYGVTVFYLGDFGVLGLVLDACGWPYFDLYNITGRSLKMLAMNWKSLKVY